MKGTWRMDQYPAATYDGQTVDFRIPFALENVAGKIGISADDTYSFGGRGTAYIGEKSKAKSITLGGKLGLQYDGVDVHPTYFGFLGGVNSLTRGQRPGHPGQYLSGNRERHLETVEHLRSPQGPGRDRLQPGA